MRRIEQTLEEILSKLTVLTTEWRDDFSGQVIDAIHKVPGDRPVVENDLRALLAEDYDAALTVFRLFLDRSKDEFTYELKTVFPPTFAPTRKSFVHDPDEFMRHLCKLPIILAMNHMTTTPVSWRTVVEERLKGGRGSAIKGQFRGRALEDFAERIIKSVLGDQYDVRCSFIGKDGRSTAKSDFAIPSKDNPFILIESKAYGATGSKQTDAVGDAIAIVEQKRHDTTLLVVTDGVSWHARTSDLKKLVRLQNEGAIYRIYTSQMETELREDLSQLKNELGI